MAPLHHITLNAPDDGEGWFAAACALAGAGISPECVQWRIKGEADDLFTAPDAPLPMVQVASPSRDFRSLARFALCHRDPERFSLLYELLLRHLTSPGLLENRADAQNARAQRLAKEVGRDRHKMTAFVRFRLTQTPAGESVFIAWFEPSHHILRLTAPFFMRRYASQPFSILTPEASVHWDGAALTYGPGARKADAPDNDTLEALWLTYYANIFNPARLKVGMMKSEMPVKYWRNLPEAALIQPLIRGAQARASAMIEAAPGLVRKAALYHPPALDPGLASCTRCPLHAQATQVVPGEGPEDARLMIVLAQVGDREDLEGRILAGQAGKLVDEALRRLKVARGSLYITHAVKHFPFVTRGRDRLPKPPAPEHIQACAPWLAQERARIQPRVILALGDAAVAALTGEERSLKVLPGQPMSLPDGTPLFVAPDPASLLKLTQNQEKRATWAAFLNQIEGAAMAAGLVPQNTIDPAA